MAGRVEVKARARDPALLAGLAERLSGSPARLEAHSDTFFAAPRGRLKLRHSADGHGQLIFYERPDAEGPKLCCCAVSPTEDPAGLTVRGCALPGSGREGRGEEGAPCLPGGPDACPPGSCGRAGRLHGVGGGAGGASEPAGGCPRGPAADGRAGHPPGGPAPWGLPGPAGGRGVSSISLRHSAVSIDTNMWEAESSPRAQATEATDCFRTG